MISQSTLFKLLFNVKDYQFEMQNCETLHFKKNFNALFAIFFISLTRVAYNFFQCLLFEQIMYMLHAPER